MYRKEFIKTAGILAAGTIGYSFLNSCAIIKYAQYSVDGDKLIVKKSEFSGLQKFVLLNVSGLPASIYLRKNENETYDMLSCPCHGSKYSPAGEAISPPAKEPLKKFDVLSDSENIYIQI